MAGNIYKRDTFPYEIMDVRIYVKNSFIPAITQRMTKAELFDKIAEYSDIHLLIAVALPNDKKYMYFTKYNNDELWG